MSEVNSKKKPVDPLTPMKTYIRNDRNGGDDDDLPFMGSPPLLPFDDPAEYEKLRKAVAKNAPADFFGQFFGRMFTDTAWDNRRIQLATTNTIKAELQQYSSDPTLDANTKLAMAVTEKLDPLERLYQIGAGRERRLEALYRLMQEHRGHLGTLLPAAAEQVQDAEFSEVADETSDENRSDQTAQDKDKS